MAVKVDFDYKKQFISDRSLEETFNYLSDLETSIPSNFPGLETFKQVEPSVFQWVFEKVGHASYEVGIELVTRVDKTPNSRITLRSVPGKSKGDVDGGWTLTSEGGKTKVDYAMRLGLEIPVPFFLKSVATTLASKGLTDIFDRYAANVGKALRS